jgi:ADP-ribose pyrophosphatase YjhB (NUDIX family)
MTATVMQQKKHYVLGFALNENHNAVLLAIKNRPEVQQGLFNGLGGVKNPAESPVQAMVRKFREECGIDTTKDDWNLFHHLEGTDYIVHCYSATMDIMKAKTKSDEEIVIRQVTDSIGWRGLEVASHRVVRDLRYLIPMACEAERALLQRF